MADNNIPPTTPSAEDIQDAFDRATALKDTVINYREVAQDIDDQARERLDNPHPSLDDLPYGEELVRTEDLPEHLDKVITALQVGLADPSKISEKTLQEIDDVIEESQDTLDDCTPIPKDDTDDDDE